MSKQSKSFEESMARLEQIVRTMEQGNAPLEESLKLFQEGTKLVQQCGSLLDHAQMEIQKVLVGADGNPVMEEFEDHAEL